MKGTLPRLSEPAPIPIFIFCAEADFGSLDANSMANPTLPRTHLSEFTAQLPHAGDDSPLVLGYPLNATFKRNEDGINVSVLRPVFFASRFKWMRQLLKVYGYIDDPIPGESGLVGICLFAQGCPAAQFPFGLRFREYHYDGGLEGAGKACAEFGRFGCRIVVISPGKNWEHLDLADISTASFREPFENGIYNRAVVMFAKRTRYSQRLLQELSIIFQAQ